MVVTGIAVSSLAPRTGARGRDFPARPDGEPLHLTNWIECMHSRRRPNRRAEADVSAAVAAHLAHQAFRSGRVADWQGTS